MSDKMMVLPGDIPGLLRRGSPVLLPDGTSMTVHRFGDGGAWGASGFGRFVNGTLNGADMGGLRLDLTDPTGRAHAAWWVLHNCDTEAKSASLSGAEAFIVEQCGLGNPSVPREAVATLRALVLRLAGRTA